MSADCRLLCRMRATRGTLTQNFAVAVPVPNSVPVELFRERFENAFVLMTVLNAYTLSPFFGIFPNISKMDEDRHVIYFSLLLTPEWQIDEDFSLFKIFGSPIARECLRTADGISIFRTRSDDIQSILRYYWANNHSFHQDEAVKFLHRWWVNYHNSFPFLWEDLRTSDMSRKTYSRTIERSGLSLAEFVYNVEQRYNVSLPIDDEVAFFARIEYGNFSY